MMQAGFDCRGRESKPRAVEGRHGSWLPVNTPVDFGPRAYFLFNRLNTPLRSLPKTNILDDRAQSWTEDCMMLIFSSLRTPQTL
jgi:hypothetical protein